MVGVSGLTGETSPGSLELAQGLVRVMDVLVDMPLASVPDLAGVRGISSSSVTRKLWELQEMGLADSEILGWSRKRLRRWWLTPGGVGLMGAPMGSWHDEWGRCRLLERLPSVEWFYRVAGFLRELGPFEAFQWLDNVSFDAAARYEWGWVMFFWSGLWQTETGIMRRLEEVSRDLRELSVHRESPRVALYCFVVSDEWQRELVYRAMAKFRLEEALSVWCVSDGLRSGFRLGIDPVRSSWGWVEQPAWPRGLGGWSWDQRIGRSFCGVDGAMVIGRVLGTVAEWPGMRRMMGQLALGHGTGGRRALEACKWLAEHGLVERSQDGGSYRYTLSPRGVDLVARRDRVNYGQSEARSKVASWQERPRLQPHEDGLMELMGQFMAAKLPVAAGWRSWEHLGSGGGISPDGLVYVGNSPYGPGWHYVEYERTARGERRAMMKLRGYMSGARQDRWPLLMAVWDVRAEGVFQQLGRTVNLPMLTTTMGRLRECPVVGPAGCWSMYGQPVSVG